MKKTLWAALAIGLLTLSTAAVLNATVILSDNFEGDDTGLNQYNFANWSVINGSVDLIGKDTDWDYFQSYGQYVDLDGSTGQSGQFTSKTSFDLGSYFLSFDLAGSQRDDTTNTVTVTLGDWTQDITLLSSAPFTSYILTIATSGGKLAFQNWGGDNIGLILDNVSVSTAQNAVPEPATMLLFGTGIAGLAGIARRKRS